MAVAALLAGGGVVAAGRLPATTSDSDATSDAATPVATVSTAAVERRTLTQDDRYDGTIGYAETRTLTAASTAEAGSTTASSPVVTSIVDAGSPLRRGDVVYELDSEPTVALYGDEPIYRTLSTDTSGADVRQLEENLVVLGYDTDGEMVVDNTYDGATAGAVERWESDLGATVDGDVSADQVIFLPGPSTVSTTSVGEGDAVSAGAPVLDVVVTATEEIVTVAGVSADEDPIVADVIDADVVVAGDVLYTMDGAPVIALVGDEPLGRDLAEGDSGTDVRMLQENLLALGYDGADVDDDTALTVDGSFGSVTRAAVEEFQTGTGQEVDGVVELTDVAVVAPDADIVERLDDAASAGVAVAPHTVVLVFGRSSRIVEVDLALEDQDELLVGDAVRIAVPGAADETTGVVAAVSAVASSGSGDTAAEAATVTVTIDVDGPVELTQIEAPVDVYVERVLAEDALVVPVSALVALAGGGYAVQVVDASTPRYVAVEPGVYADNLVEVTGDDIDEGVDVVVAG